MIRHRARLKSGAPKQTYIECALVGSVPAFLSELMSELTQL